MVGTYRKGNGGSLHLKKGSSCPQTNLYELSNITHFMQMLSVIQFQARVALLLINFYTCFY
jgi:hypothetical protein